MYILFIRVILLDIQLRWRLPLNSFRLLQPHLGCRL